MSTEHQPQATTTTEAVSPENAPTLNERMTLLREQARAERQAAVKAAASEEPGEASEGSAEPPSDEASESAAEAAPEAEDEEAARAAARAARRAALEQLAASERAADAKRRARQQQDRQQQEAPEVERLRARVAELESLATAFQDPAALLAQARKRGIDPAQFGELLRESIANPEFIVEKQLESKLTAYERKLQETEQKLQQQLAALQRQQQAANEEAEEQAAANALLTHTRGNARLAPLSVSFLERHGEDVFVQFATNIAQTLPPGCGIDRVHDAVEIALENLQLSAAPTPTPSNAKSKPTRSPAAQGKTVTNQLASQRATIPEEDEDWANLPYKERFERLKRRVNSV